MRRMSVFQIPPSRKQDRLVNEANLLRLTGHGKDVASVINFAIRHFQETDYPNVKFSVHDFSMEINIFPGNELEEAEAWDAANSDACWPHTMVSMKIKGKAAHLDARGRAVIVQVGGITPSKFWDERNVKPPMQPQNQFIGSGISVHVQGRLGSPEGPLSTLFKAPTQYLINHENISRKHVVYLHRICTLDFAALVRKCGPRDHVKLSTDQEEKNKLSYIGITKQGWQKRFNQHLSQARCGSALLFHTALREHYPKTRLMEHHVLAVCGSEQMAMELEEVFVGGLFPYVLQKDEWKDTNASLLARLHTEMSEKTAPPSAYYLGTLYPKGLNMIPGGYAGLKVLHKMGVMKDNQPFNVDQRDNLLIEGLKRGGQANPLLAAHWNDEDYATKVICGPEGRLKPPQIQEARTLGLLGRETSEITDIVGAKNERQIKNLLEGSTYSRIKKLH